jgi:hypothetical protein
MDFDYYAASVPVSPELARKGFEQAFDLVTVQDAIPRNGYRMGQEFHIRGEGVFSLFWGGHNPHPFVNASGAASAPVAQVLKAEVPSHTCARVDVFKDTDGGREEFDRVSGVLVRMARSAGLASRFISSPTDPEKGRTLYLGSPTSEVSFRYYEKDREQRDKGRDGGDLSRNRAEFQVKPKNKARKARLAQLAPQDVPGFARWSAEAVLLWSSAPDLTRREAERKSKARESIDHMLRQYRGQMLALMREEGRAAARQEFFDLWRGLEGEAFAER